MPHFTLLFLKAHVFTSKFYEGLAAGKLPNCRQIKNAPFYDAFRLLENLVSNEFTTAPCISKIFRIFFDHGLAKNFLNRFSGAAIIFFKRCTKEMLQQIDTSSMSSHPNLMRTFLDFVCVSQHNSKALARSMDKQIYLRLMDEILCTYLSVNQKFLNCVQYKKMQDCELSQVKVDTIVLLIDFNPALNELCFGDIMDYCMSSLLENPVLDSSFSKMLLCLLRIHFKRKHFQFFLIISRSWMLLFGRSYAHEFV